MLRVRPAQLITTAVSSSTSIQQIGDPKSQLAVRDAATARYAGSSILFRRACIQNHHSISALHPLRSSTASISGTTVFPPAPVRQIFAGNIHAPLSRKSLSRPAVHTATERAYIGIAQRDQSPRRERRPAPVVVADYNGRSNERSRLRDTELQLPSRNQTRADDMGTVVLALPL